jgi:antitoxin ParD1/3/4
VVASSPKTFLANFANNRYIQFRRFLMATMNVSLPNPMRKWIEDRIKSGEYANASDYVRDLVRHDRERHERLVEALIEGEKSGISPRTVSEIVAGAKTKIRNGKG